MEPPNQSASSEETGAEPRPIEEQELTILNGGVQMRVEKIDGSFEEVKVRQLPISLIDQWGNSQGDEAFLVELLCDRVDRSTDHHLRHARASEQRVVDLMRAAKLEQIGEFEERLQKLRTEIAALEKKPRWSDSLTEESVVQIRELGARLNKKKFGNWAKRTRQAIQESMKEASSALASSPPGSQSSSNSGIPAT